MHRLKTIFVFFVVCFFPLPAHCVTPFEIYEGSVLNQAVQRNKLVVGMEVKFFPFEYADTQGKPIGFDVDLAGLIAQELGVELEIRDMEFSGLIPALQGGKIDMIISGMTRTLARARTVTFTQPYFVTGLCALLSNRKAPDVTDVKQLDAPDRIIAVKLGTTGDITAAKMFPKARINRYKEETACVLEVVSGRADAFLYDQLSISKHHKQNPDTTRALLKPFTYEPYAIAIRSGDFDFENWLNLFLETIKADGRYQALHGKYFSDL